MSQNVLKPGEKRWDRKTVPFNYTVYSHEQCVSFCRSVQFIEKLDSDQYGVPAVHRLDFYFSVPLHVRSRKYSAGGQLIHK